MRTFIRVGAKPDSYDAPGQFLDGDIAQAFDTRVQVDEATQTLVIKREGHDDIAWPLDQIRQVPDAARDDLLVLRLRDDPVARLIVTDRVITHRLPHLTRRAPVRKRGQLFLAAIAAIASVALIILVLVPTMADQLAEYIPPEGERALGETTLDQIRGALDQTGMQPIPFCENPQGRAALNKIETRLTDAMTLDQTLTVHVLNHEMVNAFALPGGNIVFFNGLIEEAETPEEVAAVFAHEIGHVVSRDPTRHALRSAGSIGVLGLLFGDFAGGAVVLFLTERLIEARYSKDAESDADSFAFDLMRAADLPPTAMGSFFTRLRDRGGEPDAIIAHFLSHPDIADRIAASEGASTGDTRPLLTDAEWQALRGICDFDAGQAAEFELPPEQ